MYKQYFGLRVEPFTVNPDPRFLYMTPSVQEALASLSYGIHSRKGILLLTGEVGTGKTTIINKLLEWLHRMNYVSAYLFNARIGVDDFFDVMMVDFGIACESREKGLRLLKLNQWLMERYRAGQVAVLIVDEAQGLSMELLEELRLLTNLETFTQKLLQVVLCGQPELDAKLKAPKLRQLRQRIMIRCRTRPFTAQESRAYIHERLHKAGVNGLPVFGEEAIEAISRYSCGIPRIINLLCEHSLISAFADQQRPIAAETIRAVAEEFDLEQTVPPLSSLSLPNRGFVEPQRNLTAESGTAHLERASQRDFGEAKSPQDENLPGDRANQGAV